MEKITLDASLDDVQAELNRFQTKLIEYRKRAENDKWAQRGCKQSASLRRSALDLKQELTKITQSIGY